MGAASATQHNTGTGLWRAREIILDSAGLQQKGGAQCSEHTLGASQASQNWGNMAPLSDDDDDNVQSRRENDTPHTPHPLGGPMIPSTHPVAQSA